jgi:methionine-gamma-lyase
MARGAGARDAAGAGGGAGARDAAGTGGAAEGIIGAATPMMVCLDCGASAASGFSTVKACPHLGHRIFRPVGGTRRSSTWYGALHASHSTFSISRRKATTESRYLARVSNPTPSYSERLSQRVRALTTACVHAGDTPDPSTHSLEAPIALSSAFGFASAAEAAGAFAGENDAYIYGRWGNPSVDALEAKMAALEGAEDACATASGMAAIAGAVLAVCSQGSHVIAPRAMYAESARLLRERLPRWGITTTFVDGTDPEAYAAAITPETRVLYLETPANPNLAITDLEAVAGIAKGRGLVTIADNTFATPFAQSPLALGIDLVVHSMTKAIGGHGDAIGGVVCGRKVDIARVQELVVKGLGAVLSPFGAYLVARGARTFALRQRQACETAAILATKLEAHPRIARVHHPSLASHPGHALATRQMHAYGSILSFEVVGSGDGDASAIAQGKRVLEGVRTITHAVSLGDVKSLLVHPASTTHSTMPREDRARAHISDGLLRLSVGIEAADDLWGDLSEALDSKT